VGLDVGWLLGEVERGGADVEGVRKIVDRICGEGLGERVQGRVRLTDRGILVADGVAGEMMGLVPS
jgi:hypothetical protein